MPIDEEIVDIAAGDDHALLLTAGGEVYGMGAYTGGKLDGITTAGHTDAPVLLRLPSSAKVYDIAADQNSSHFLTRSGDVVTLGKDNSVGISGSFAYDQGQTGTLTATDRGPVYADTTATLMAISTGANSVLAIDVYGKVHVWGNNTHGQLGNGTNTNVMQPTSDTTFNFTEDGEESVAILVSAGAAGYVRYLDKTVKAAGSNHNGQLGVNQSGSDLASRNTADYVMAGEANGDDASANLDNIMGIATSPYGNFTLVYDNEHGSVYAWGDNQYGQLGDGTYTDKYLPVSVLENGGGSYLDVDRIFVNGQAATIHYDTIILDADVTYAASGEVETAVLATSVKAGDVVKLDLGALMGYLGFNAYGERTYKPDLAKLSVVSVNSSVAEASNDGTITTKDTGFTYIVVTDELEIGRAHV